MSVGLKLFVSVCLFLLCYRKRIFFLLFLNAYGMHGIVQDPPDLSRCYELVIFSIVAVKREGFYNFFLI